MDQQKRKEIEKNKQRSPSPTPTQSSGSASASMSTAESPSLESPACKKPRLTAAGGTCSSSNSSTALGNNQDSSPVVMNSVSTNGSANNNGASAGNMANGGSGAIDESLYSRQIAVLGEDAMRRMAESKILVSGLGGLGVEVAKNVILGGVKSVTLQDDKVTTWDDLSSQFYLKKADIGKNRAEQSLTQLSELNPYVSVYKDTAPLTCELIRNGGFNMVVVTDGAKNHEELINISQYCHESNISFILAETRGLFARVFCDFGENFTIRDTNGEVPVSTMIAGITKEAKGAVTCLDESRHGLEDGDHVTFTEIQGMEELNGHAPIKIEVTGPYTFKLNLDTTGLSDYIRGGVVTQVKMPKTLKFKPLKESISAPEFLIADYAKMDRNETINIAFQALDLFKDEHKRYPVPWNTDDANLLFTIASTIASRNEVDISEKFTKIFSYICSGQICPMNGFIGGTVAQEVMKAVSGKFTPIYQWIFFDSLECLPFDFNDDGSPKVMIDENDFQGRASRYDGQIAVFGQRFQETIGRLKYFIVGAGAIGCELLKNFAMMGVGAQESGKVIVTDMDLIERSNLNRQFLFRPKDVGLAKSACAAAAVKEMNPEINIEHQENRVGADSENIYNDEFFEELSGVANALDNVDARIYMDRRCVYYRKPLLESGTLGTKGNSQVVLPNVTESYSSSQDPPEKSIPICTLKNFPNAIEHTLQWARDMFEGIFKQNAENAAQYLKDSRFMERTLRLPGCQPLEVLESVKKCLVDDRPSTFENCVEWARFLWEDSFNNTIEQLLFNFPPDQTTTSGQLFWSAPKRCPKAMKFSLEEPLCLDFVYSAANLRAEMYGIPQVRDRTRVGEMAMAVNVPLFVPRSGVRIAITDAEAQNQAGSGYVDSNRLDELKQIFASTSFQGVNITPIEFEKDDDNNLHMEFIVAASNSRATNYSIQNADRFKSKIIAGKIIPAIATTTSVVSSLVCIELIKIAQNMTDIGCFKNGFVNLALPFFGFSEPIAAPKNKYHDTNFTLWDRFEVSGEMTLKEFLDHFKTVYDLEITMLSQGVCMLYSFFMAKDKREERLQLPLVEVVRRVSRKSLEPHVKALVFELCCNDRTGEDVEVPYVRYEIPASQLSLLQTE